MTHALIIRFHYKQDDPRFDWRLAYFKAMVWPRILAQTNQDFDVCIWCNIWHVDQINSLSNEHKKVKIFRVERERVDYKKLNGKKYFLDFTPWDEVVGLAKYDIQSGLDSDDLIDENYIQRIKDEIKKLDDGKTTIHLSFQPKIFDTRSLEVRGIGKVYSERNGSAFMSLYQPVKNPYRFIYEDSHLRLGRFAGKSIVIEEGHCYATVHGINESTGK